jgi:adenylate cyclase
VNLSNWHPCDVRPDPGADGRKLVRLVTKRLVALGWIANAIGAAVVFAAIGFLLTVFFDDEQSNQLGQENWPFMVGGFIVFGVAMTALLKRRRSAALRWLVEERAPTPEEHRLTLHLPVYNAMLTAAAWFVGAAIGAALNLDHSAGTAAVIAVSLWLGGETTSALAYLMTERALRPVTARALAAREPERRYSLSVRNRLLFAWSLGTGVPVMSLLGVGIVGLTKDGVDPTAVAAACLFLGCVALFVGLFATLMAARAISDPLTHLREAFEKVGQGNLDLSVEIDDASEVGQLQAGFNRMADGLRERERIRDLFGRQVGRDVALQALRGGTRLGGEEREIGAVFVDLTGSTTMAVAMPPAAVVRLLNKFFRVVIDAVESEGGFVNKFEGDAALCVFGAPVRSEDPAGDALCAARRLAERLEREVPEVGFGIGVSAGKAVAGNVGSEQRFEYTVIGDPVNEAARLSDLAKEREVSVLASECALELAVDVERDEWEVGERTVLRGRLEATGLAMPRA